MGKVNHRTGPRFLRRATRHEVAARERVLIDYKTREQNSKNGLAHGLELCFLGLLCLQMGNFSLGFVKFFCAIIVKADSAKEFGGFSSQESAPQQ
jgi:hypothetical protein